MLNSEQHRPHVPVIQQQELATSTASWGIRAEEKAMFGRRQGEISLAGNATPEVVLEQAQRVLESIGYECVQTEDGTLEAYEGGRPAEDAKYAFRLVLKLRIEGDKLILDAESNGLRLTGATMGPVAFSRIRRHFRKANHAVTDSLRSAGLA
jgi:hypothetical protein